ncbi:MAG: hypothetical protein RLY86_667 [Pseudomonadota bacterium]|jgi:hypothetical protein
MTTIPVPPGYMKDAKGRLVPDSLVKPADKLMDQTVRSLIGHAEALSARIGRFKGHCFDDVNALLALLAEQYGETRGGAKGNVSLTSFDGCLKVQVAVSDRIAFGPELQIAKSLVDQCIISWSEGARAEICALVDGAFQVDKEGTVNREALLRLRRLDIRDETWTKAMEALTDSIRVEGSKTYMRFYRRVTPEDAWSPISIDLAAVSAPAPTAAAAE